jgi:drug/metabolite transporter (DMT)-like permease
MKTSSKICGLMLSAVWGVSQLHVYKDAVHHFKENKFHLKEFRLSHCLILTLILVMWRIWWAPNSIPIYIQQDATLHSLFISGNCSTCIGWYFHLSSGAHTTVSTASGICHTVTAICRYRGRVGTGCWIYIGIYLQCKDP